MSARLSVAIVDARAQGQGLPGVIDGRIILIERPEIIAQVEVRLHQSFLEA